MRNRSKAILFPQKQRNLTQSRKAAENTQSFSWRFLPRPRSASLAFYGSGAESASYIFHGGGAECVFASLRALLPMMIATGFFFYAPMLSAQSKTTLGEIKKSLICLCECNMTVEACEGAMACDSAEKLTAEARPLIDQGLSQKEVLATFIGRYGEHILAAPTKKGFNLAAWILPFAAIFFAGVSIVTVLRRWVRRPQEQNGKSKPNTALTNDPAYEKKLDEVLRALD